MTTYDKLPITTASEVGWIIFCTIDGVPHLTFSVTNCPECGGQPMRFAPILLDESPRVIAACLHEHQWRNFPS